MKAIKWIAAGSAGIGALFLLLIPISYIFNGGNAIIGLHLANYFHAANSFFLITIILFIYVYVGHGKKE